MDGTLAATAAAGDRLELAGVLCARLCHDLAGTLGALGGMLDLLAESGPAGGDPEALALARVCARELSDRLRLLRAAWGRDSEMPDLASLLAGLPGADRLAVDRTGLAAALDGGTAQLVLSLLLVAAAGLPRGGRIWVAGGAAGLSLRIEGLRAAWPAALADCIADPTAGGLEPRGVGAAIACLQARALGLHLRVVSPVQLEAAPVTGGPPAR